MQEIIIANLSLPTHSAAIIYLLNEYAKDDMGGSAELSAFVQNNLIAELRKRQGVHVVLAFVDGSPAGMAICFEGFSTFACKPLLNIHDIIVAKAYRGRGIAKSLLASGFAGYELDPRMSKARFWQNKLGEGTLAST